jgi:hypothetical protein
MFRSQRCFVAEKMPVLTSDLFGVDFGAMWIIIPVDSGVVPIPKTLLFLPR